MKLMTIDEDGNAFYYKSGSQAPIRDIERDDLLDLIRAVAEHDDIELDACTKERSINNPIEETIYSQIYKELHDLNEHRELYLSEIESQFDELERNYGLGPIDGS